MKQITTTLLLLVAAASLSHGDQPPAAAPKAKAPAGAQSIAPDGKMKMVETQTQDVTVARNHKLLHAEMVTVYPHTMTSVSGPHCEITRWIEVFFPREGVAAVLSGAATVPDLSGVTIMHVTPDRYAGKTENITASRLAEYKQATTRYRPSDILELTPAALAVIEKSVADHVAQRNEQDTTTQLLRDAVTKILPSGWTLKQVIHGRVAPTHLAPADGMEIRIERTGYTADDWKHGRGGEIHVWLMPKDYKPGTPPGGAQVAPAHEMIFWRTWRVFVWGSGGTDWPTWENGITAALQKTETSAAQAPDEPPPPPAGAAAKGLEKVKPIAADANYRRAIETEGQTTAPYYVLVQVVNDGTRESRMVCVEPSQLLRALCMEKNLPATAEGLEKAKEAALKQADRVFRFSNREALALAQPRYTETILTEVRQYLSKNGSTEDAVKQITDQTSALYRFCNKTGGSLHAYLAAVAHVFMENGLACGRSCKPGLIFVEKAGKEEEMNKN